MVALSNMVVIPNTARATFGRESEYIGSGSRLEDN